MFVSKSSSLPLSGAPERWVCFALICNINKHSNLLQTFISYTYNFLNKIGLDRLASDTLTKLKRLYITDTSNRSYKTFSSSLMFVFVPGKSTTLV
jgi:hypothetical protein